ncbi:hypothetical protein NX059_011010 [Plenodomus lindquistii]|nr:hypothetical protein NX059_011010 [Plenodomus lindquistii]
MPASWRPLVGEKLDYIVVDREENEQEVQAHNLDVEDPTATVDRILGRSYTKRQAPPLPTDVDSDSDDEDDYPSSNSTSSTSTLTSTTQTMLPTGMPEFRITMTLGAQPQTTGAFADNDPGETIIVALPPPPRHGGDGRGGKMSQTTEHLLIAAGSIGATIIIVMIVLGLYTMRKRGLSFADVLQRGKSHVRRGPPLPPSRYGMDQKQYYDIDYERGQRVSIYPPQRAASLTRSSSSRSQRPLQALGRSDSFGQGGLIRTGSVNKSFYDDTTSESNSHRRNDSATPSSPVLPVQGLRQSASTRNTRSLDGDVDELRYPDDSPTQRALPPPPTFRQFLSNRPSASQRPGLGGAMPSRFSWTNSNAPQTPHELSRDTAAAPIGRDSFMTQRSSVPRFRTVDSWVNQQSTRVEEQRLKQQFRMTQSSTSSGGGDHDRDIDTVPEMPPVPKNLSLSRSASNRSAAGGGGLAGKNIKHARHDTQTTAPIFRAHPGTEVRFSVRSEVPSEVLDMGRKNAAL